MALVAASIDFGTTFSGWAFSFKHAYEKEPTCIQAKHWQEVSYCPSKAPTCVLITADGKTVEAFGYEAENRYAELAVEGSHRKWFFFTKFKMKLYKSEGIIGKHMWLEDETGKN